MFFESAGFYAYDVAGTLKWKLDLGNIAKGGLGPGTSPLIYENLVILQCDQEMGEGSFLAAFDDDWQGGLARDADDAPQLGDADRRDAPRGRDELVTSGAETVIAYDPKTGKELWTAPGIVSHPIPSFVTGQAGSCSPRRAARPRSCWRCGPGRSRAPLERVAWKYNKGAAYVTSPIFYGDYLYLVSDAGIMTLSRSR